MLQVESGAQKKVSFADVMGKQEDSDAEDYFSTEDDKVSGVATETLIALPIAPGAKRRKTISALLDIGASESLMAPELLVEMLKDHMDNVTKMPKSTWNTGMGKFEADKALLIENITLPIFTVNRKFPINFTMLPKLKMASALRDAS